MENRKTGDASLHSDGGTSILLEVSMKQVARPSEASFQRKCLTFGRMFSPQIQSKRHVCRLDWLVMVSKKLAEVSHPLGLGLQYILSYLKYVFIIFSTISRGSLRLSIVFQVLFSLM